MKRIREFLLEADLSARTILSVAALAAVLLGILALPYLNRGGDLVEIQGVVIGPFDQADQAASAYYMRVALESGEEVFVRIPRELPVRNGKVVVLSRRRGHLGLTRYAFRRYLNGNC